MNPEQIHNDELHVLSLEEEKVAKEREEIKLKQKLDVQVEVMKKLGFLPHDFDKKQYQMPASFEERAQAWSAVLVDGEKSRANMFDSFYKKHSKDYSDLVFSSDELGELTEKIIEEFNSKSIG